MSVCQLRTLAQSIHESTTLLSESWHDNEHHDLSSCASQGISIPPVNKMGEAARNQLISSLRKLERLVLGPKDTLQSMYFRSAETGVVHALCNLKVPHNIPKDGSISYTELATKLQVNQDRLTHLIRNAIVCSDFLAETANGMVTHSAMSSIWYKDPVMAAGNEVMLDNLPLSSFNIAKTYMRDPMDHDDAVSPFSVYRNDVSLFQWFEQNPEQGRKFAAHMRAQSSKHGDDAVRNGYDWNHLAGKTLVDCGGSFGSVGAAILSKEPNIDITVQDLPKVIESARAAARAPNSSIPSTLKFAAHSFLEPQPAVADVYLYRMVFHNWSDAGARRILRALQPALRHGSRVILIEYVMPKMGTAPDYAELQTRRLDNTMYALMNGKVRELDEFKTLFSEVEPRLRFDSYRAGELRATHDPRSHSVMSWVFEAEEQLKPAELVAQEQLTSAEVAAEASVVPEEHEIVENIAIEIEDLKHPSAIIAEIQAPNESSVVADGPAVNATEPIATEEVADEPPSPTSSHSSRASDPLPTPKIDDIDPPSYVLPRGTQQKVVSHIVVDVATDEF